MIIYKTTNLITNKIYVGQDKRNRPNYLGSGVIFRQSVKKHGRENFIKEILEYCISVEHMNEREIFWIKELDSRNPKIGYNICAGGSFGDTMSTHPRKKEIFRNHSEKLKGRKQTKEHVDARMLGRENRSEEDKAKTFEKLSKISKDKKQSLEHKEARLKSLKTTMSTEKYRENQRNAQIGKKRSPETCLNIGLSKKGIIQSATVIESRIKHQRKPIIIDDIEYPSMKDAAESLGKLKDFISKRVRNPDFPNYRYKNEKD